MSLIDALILNPAQSDVWIVIRNDNQIGSGTADDPFHGGIASDKQITIGLSRTDFEGKGDSGTQPHGLVEGDMAVISGVAGSPGEQWNRMFRIYDVNPEGTTFKFALGIDPPVPLQPAKVSRVHFRFDEVMRTVPPNMRVNLGPGEFLTRGYGHHWSGGWQPKTGQKIVGMGFDVTTIKLLGAGVVKVGDDLIEQHYHAIGMPVIPHVGGTTAITPLEHFEVSNLTIDCNLGNQPLRGPKAVATEDTKETNRQVVNQAHLAGTIE